MLSNTMIVQTARDLHNHGLYSSRLIIRQKASQVRESPF
jgi:hypothetical protein